MKTHTLIHGLFAGLLLAGVAAPVFADAEAQALCERYAQEDGIGPSEMAEYMRDCLDSIKSDNDNARGAEEDDGKPRT